MHHTKNGARQEKNMLMPHNDDRSEKLHRHVVISPITKTDWEGTGVEPDVKVAAADALDEALKRARDQTASAGSPR